MKQTPSRPRRTDPPGIWAAWMVEQRLSYRDIGRLMGVSKQAAHRRLRRAVDAIRQYEATRARLEAEGVL